MTLPASAPKPNVRLQPLDPDNERDVQELVKQRRECGWGEDSIEKWRKMIRSGERLMYWIILDEGGMQPNGSVESSHIPPKGLEKLEESFDPAGHVALDWVDYLGDESLANKDNGIITATTFFISRKFQGLGLGRKTMLAVEDKAKYEYGCHTITLNCMPAEVHKDPKWQKILNIEFDPSKQPVTVEWYERMGYKTYKLAPRHKYTWNGKEDVLECVFMKKPL